MGIAMTWKLRLINVLMVELAVMIIGILQASAGSVTLTQRETSTAARESGLRYIDELVSRLSGYEYRFDGTSTVKFTNCTIVSNSTKIFQFKYEEPDRAQRGLVNGTFDNWIISAEANPRGAKDCDTTIGHTVVSTIITYHLGLDKDRNGLWYPKISWNMMLYYNDPVEIDFEFAERERLQVCWGTTDSPGVGSVCRVFNGRRCDAFTEGRQVCPTFIRNIAIEPLR
jgi:hypothetical protein